MNLARLFVVLLLCCFPLGVVHAQTAPSPTEPLPAVPTTGSNIAHVCPANVTADITVYSLFAPPTAAELTSCKEKNPILTFTVCYHRLQQCRSDAGGDCEALYRRCPLEYVQCVERRVQMVDPQKGHMFCNWEVNIYVQMLFLSTNSGGYLPQSCVFASCIDFESLLGAEVSKSCTSFPNSVEMLEDCSKMAVITNTGTESMSAATPSPSVSPSTSLHGNSTSASSTASGASPTTSRSETANTVSGRTPTKSDGTASTSTSLTTTNSTTATPSFSKSVSKSRTFVPPTRPPPTPVPTPAPTLAPPRTKTLSKATHSPSRSPTISTAPTATASIATPSPSGSPSHTAWTPSSTIPTPSATVPTASMTTTLSASKSHTLMPTLLEIFPVRVAAETIANGGEEKKINTDGEEAVAGVAFSVLLEGDAIRKSVIDNATVATMASCFSVRVQKATEYGRGFKTIPSCQAKTLPSGVQTEEEDGVLTTVHGSGSQLAYVKILVTSVNFTRVEFVVERCGDYRPLEEEELLVEIAAACMATNRKPQAALITVAAWQETELLPTAARLVSSALGYGAGAVSAMGAAPALGLVAQRTGALIALAQCNEISAASGKGANLAFWQYPFQAKVGPESTAVSMAYGATIFNPVLTFLFFAIHFIIVVAVGCVLSSQRTKRGATFSTVAPNSNGIGDSGDTVSPTAGRSTKAVVTGTADGSFERTANLLRFPFVGLAAFLYFIQPSIMAASLTLNNMVKQQDKTQNIIMQTICGVFIALWIGITAFLCSKIVFTQRYFKSVWEAANPDIQTKLEWYVKGPGKWVDGYNRGHGFTRRFGALFILSREGCQWFAVVEFTCSIVLAFIEGFRPQEDCKNAVLAMAAVLLLYCLMLVALRPYASPHNLLFLIAIGFCQFAGALLVALYLYDVLDSLDGVAIVTIVIFALLFIRLVFDVLVFIHFRFLSGPDLKTLNSTSPRRLTVDGKESSESTASAVTFDENDDDEMADLSAKPDPAFEKEKTKEKKKGISKTRELFGDSDDDENSLVPKTMVDDLFQDVLESDRGAASKRSNPIPYKEGGVVNEDDERELDEMINSVSRNRGGDDDGMMSRYDIGGYTAAGAVDRFHFTPQRHHQNQDGRRESSSSMVSSQMPPMPSRLLEVPQPESRMGGHTHEELLFGTAGAASDNFPASPSMLQASGGLSPLTGLPPLRAPSFVSSASPRHTDPNHNNDGRDEPVPSVGGINNGGVVEVSSASPSSHIAGPYKTLAERDAAEKITQEKEQARSVQALLKTLWDDDDHFAPNIKDERTDTGRQGQLHNNESIFASSASSTEGVERQRTDQHQPAEGGQQQEDADAIEIIESTLERKEFGDAENGKRGKKDKKNKDLGKPPLPKKDVASRSKKRGGKRNANDDDDGVDLKQMLQDHYASFSSFDDPISQSSNIRRTAGKGVGPHHPMPPIGSAADVELRRQAMQKVDPILSGVFDFGPPQTAPPPNALNPPPPPLRIGGTTLFSESSSDSDDPDL